MPILQYECPKCGKKFEELVKNHDEAVECPACGAPAKREWSGCMTTPAL
ncbi:MAG: zinc ribbon domain-containing protein, partial [Clostridia bacterium]|nr:zinc ribbon domain-containing protein [Clostridia bacterium]